MALGNGERYYSPAYARFIQQDSFKGNLTDPASLNRYSYVRNNPNKFVDPSGNEPVTISIAGFVLISFLVSVAFSVIQQDQEIKSGTRRQEDFSLSEAAVANTIIGSSYRAATGTDAVTGQKLTSGERAFASIEVALEFTSIAGKAFGTASKFGRYAMINDNLYAN